MYGKIFEMMYEGSLYGNWEAIVTFQQMIVIADDEGFVDITPMALAAKTSIPLDIIEKGIEVLESNDPYSRTEGQDGKRIIRINENRPWGWQIVNYIKYRDMASHEDRKAYMRQYMVNRRKQEKLMCKQDVNTSKQSVADVTHTDTNTDTDKKTPDFSSLKNRYPNQDLINQVFQAIASTRKCGKVANSILYNQLKKWARYPVEIVEAGIQTYLDKDCAGQGKREEYLLGIMRNLNGNKRPHKLQTPSTQKQQPTLEELFSND